jgi:DNA-binding winged helix-turn-helix (wHTH) protein
MADISPSRAAVRAEMIDLSRAAPFRIGKLLVKPALREIARDGERQTVEPRMLQVLIALWEERGEVVSRERLIQRAWGGRIVSDDAINNCIAKLRRMGEAREAFAVETVSRVGYRLVERPDGPPQRARPRRFWPLVVAALALVGMAALAVWAARGPAPIKTVVQVDAFEATADGAALAGRVRDHVTAALAAQQLDFVATGKASAPALRVAGAVDANGPAAQVRVTVADGRSGAILWQAAFNGSSALDSPLPEQATARAATAISMAAEMHAASRGEISPQALRAYVQGRDGFRERRNLIEQVAHMRTVTKEAPRLALGHASTAQILASAAWDQPAAVREAWLREAVAEAKLAIRLDPSVGIAYTALSNALGQKDYAGRQAVLEEGLRRAPLDGAVQSYFGLFLAETGRPMEGLPYVRRSQSIDPFAAPRQFGNATYFATLGAADEGRAQIARSRRTWPENGRIPVFSSLFAVLAAEPGEGREIVRELGRSFPNAVARPDLWLSYFDALQCRCRTDEVAQAIRRAAISGEIEPGMGFTALARLGAVSEALDVAQSARNEDLLRDHRLLFARQTAPMRRDRRFMDLAGKLGLAGYWRTSGRWPEFCAEPGLPYDCKAEAERVTGGIPP